MKDKNLYSRRHFLGAATLALAATDHYGANLVNNIAVGKKAEKELSDDQIIPLSSKLKQIQAGVLSVGYAASGPVDGHPIILLHGWPYDIDSYSVVSMKLAEKGFRVLVPYLRGHGTTRFLSEKTIRNGQQSALATDIIDFMNALKIEKAVIGGYDWGARTANIIAALWPDRCKSLISVSGYLIGSQSLTQKPLLPSAELSWWYMFYFATERGRLGYQEHTREFARLIWKSASPKWQFEDSTFERSAAAFDNPDHVAIVIHNYRWRIAAENGEEKYEKYEKLLSRLPEITVPTVTIEGDANGAPHPDPKSYSTKFTGKYLHINLTGGIGHNPPQEAPQAFTDAVIRAVELAKD